MKAHGPRYHLGRLRTSEYQVGPDLSLPMREKFRDLQQPDPSETNPLSRQAHGEGIHILTKSVRSNLALPP